MDVSAAYPIAMTVLVPVFSAVSCGILALFSLPDSLTPAEKKLKRVLLVYLSLSALGWYTFFCYEFQPGLFVLLNTVCLLGFVLPSIFFYRVIRYLTRLGLPERFPPWHYLAPGVLAGVMLGWSLFVPGEVQLEIVTGKALVTPPGYGAYTRFFTIKPLARVIFGLVYYALTIGVLVRYYKKMSERDTLARAPARWVIFLVAISVASLLSSLLPTFMPRGKILYSIWTSVVTLSIAAQHVLLTYHVIRREYVLYAVPEPEGKVPGDAAEKTPRRQHSGSMSRLRLETYFVKEKPYLNPGYKITDLVEALDVNRTVISEFINREYGMNFNRYLNHWRLREVERLRSLPGNEGKSESALVKQAGFGEYRQYTRALAAGREGGEP